MPPRTNPYARFAGRDLTLNDLLAIDRTVLANERTVLAYARTALAMLAVGGSAIKFFSEVWIQLLGVPFVGGAVLVMLLGWLRYRRTAATLRVNDAKNEPPAP
jgi:putative membrane protein